jgi:hypothetical protein
MTTDSKPKLTHLKPVKEYKKLDCLPPFFIHLDEVSLEELSTQLEDFKGKLAQFKEEGWEGIEEDYNLDPALHKTHLVEDEEYDKAITAALQNKPSWDDLKEEVMSIGISLWKPFKWRSFNHTNPNYCVFVENRPGINDD